MRDHNYFVYFMTNKHKNVLYLGVTNNLGRRVNEHKTGDFKGFTKKNTIVTTWFTTSILRTLNMQLSGKRK